MFQTPWRRQLLTLICGLLASLPGLVFSQAAREVSPAEAKVRAFLEVGVAGGPIVFSGAEFPKLTLEPSQAVHDHLGPHRLGFTYYDRSAQRAYRPTKPGPYATIIAIEPEKARASHRLITLYRLAEAIGPETRFTAESLDAFARAGGLDVSIVKQQQALVISVLRDRKWSQCASDPRVAELLAGLSLSKLAEQPPRKNLDAIAVQRQWWVDVKRREYKLTERYPQPIVAPVKVADLHAPEVKAGTLTEAGMNADAADTIDAVLNAWAADTDEAFAVCVVRNGVIVLHKAYGTRDGQPMTVTTQSWMASITKSMSATLMMMLVDQGLVDLDKPVDEYLPELKHINVPTPLTVRHLYTHTNGLHVWPGWSDEGPGVESRVADAYPFVHVGRAWAYNGLGYTLGGKIIEDTSGEAMPQFYVKHLLEPLGCEHTDVLGTHADARSVPLDIAKFGQMLLNRGAYGNLRFMRPATFDQMLPKKLTITLGPMATKTFGIGLDGQADSGKFGHGAASAATFHIDTHDKLVVVMTRNKIGANYDKYNGQFFEAIRSGIAK